MGFSGDSVVKNLPAMQKLQETWVWSLGWEDLLKEEMATNSHNLARIIPWTEKPGGLCPWGHKELDMTEATEHAHMHSTINMFHILNQATSSLNIKIISHCLCMSLNPAQWFKYSKYPWKVRWINYDIYLSLQKSLVFYSESVFLGAPT